MLGVEIWKAHLISVMEKLERLCKFENCPLGVHFTFLKILIVRKCALAIYLTT